MAILLAVYTATSGIGASVALEVTFTTTPDLRARNWGSTACVIAITPKVLVSNTSRTVAIGVASKAPKSPMPALLTSTSMGPLASSAAAMLLGLRHVERQHAEAFRPGQNVFARRSHGGDHVPALRVEVARGLEAIARGATSNEHGLHVDSFAAIAWLHGANDSRGAGLSTIESPHFICESPDMSDPLSEVIALLQPRTVFSKRISGAGRWGVRYSDFGQPSFCAVLEGSCRLAVDGQRALTLEAGDFVLLPATPGFTMSGFEPVKPERIDPKVTPAPTGEVRHGTRGGRPDVRLLGGYFVFDSPDAALLVSLLPALVHVRGVERLSVLVRLVGEESSERRSGRDLVLTRLVEVLLIEALRSTSGEDAPPGLLRGLADARLAPAMRQMHGQLARSWTVAQLAKTAALSRSAFFERFTRTVGLPPMEYLLAWRMAVAKDLLRRHDVGLAEVAERVGYGSASTFSTAFSRHVGQPPSRYARER